MKTIGCFLFLIFLFNGMNIQGLWAQKEDGESLDYNPQRGSPSDFVNLVVNNMIIEEGGWVMRFDPDEVGEDAILPLSVYRGIKILNRLTRPFALQSADTANAFWFDTSMGLNLRVSYNLDPIWEFSSVASDPIVSFGSILPDGERNLGGVQRWNQMFLGDANFETAVVDSLNVGGQISGTATAQITAVVANNLIVSDSLNSPALIVQNDVQVESLSVSSSMSSGEMNVTNDLTMLPDAVLAVEQTVSVNTLSVGGVLTVNDGVEYFVQDDGQLVIRIKS